jgi:glycosyltransferase domain-containing protein
VETLENITIIVPTHMNRTSYLERMLDFYSTQEFSGKIVIGDSSEEPALSNNLDLVKKYQDLNIRHIIYPKSKYTNAGKIATDITKYIDTDYVCFSGDDDFQFPETLKICIDFLKYNPNHIGAHGCKVKYDINLYEETNQVKIENVSYVRGQQLDTEDPVFRFRAYMRSETSPQYHVMRKSVWESMNKYSFSLPDTYFLVSEVLPCSLYYISGKVKRFDNIVQYMMEQTDVSYQSMNIDYIIQGINSKGWGECLTAIRDLIVDALVEKGVSVEIAGRAFDEEYNFRVLRLFHDQFAKKYQTTFEEFNKIYQAHIAIHDKGQSLSESTLKDSISMIVPNLISFINGKA